MMQTILKGDDSGAIAIALADGYNYAGCVVEVRYQGAVRLFRDCHEGQTLQFSLTAAETAPMALGAFPVQVRLQTADGRFYTVNNASVKIEVTDCITDVREGGVIIVEPQSGLYGVDDLPERYTTKDIRAKINEIIQRLGGGVAALCLAACVACGSLFGAGVTVQKANLEDIHNDEKVVTGVTLDASGLATGADVQQAEARAKAHADDAAADKITAGTATNVAGRVVSNVVTKAFVEGLGVSGEETDPKFELWKSNPNEAQIKAGYGSTAGVDSATYGQAAKGGRVAVTVGSRASTENGGHGGVAIGYSATVTNIDAIAIGDEAHSHGNETVSFPDFVTPEKFYIGSKPISSLFVPVTRKVNGQPLTEDIYIEGMSGNALCWDNDAVKTHDGSKIITAGDIGAISTSTGGIVRLSNSDAGAGFKKTSTGYTSFYVGYNAFGTIDNGARFQWANGGYADWFSGSVLRMLTGSQMWLLSGTKPWLQTDTDFHIGGNAYGGGTTLPAYVDGRITSKGYQTSTQVQTAIDNAGHAMDADIAPIRTKVEQSLIYSSDIYQYMAGNTNAWFSGTNYVTTADGTTRTQFVWEDGMDAGTVPCSMSLWEIRDGQKVVWDQRDWTVWYWNFKAAQLSNNLARVTGDLAEEVNTNCMKRGWAKYTAVRGLDNPDPSTLWIDTPKVQLMAGHQWEKIVEVGGAGYWTISGNGINLSQQDAESTFLTIKDFEGNACLTFRKTSSYLVYCQCGTDIVSNYMDAQNRVVFHLTTDVQPTAEFSTTLEDDSFVEQGTDGCPANYEWTGSAGSWDCHFILKPGITAKACFARFKVMREGENVVEHTVPIKINGGIVFEQNGQTLKCKPVAQGTSVGSTVNWVIAQ